MNIFSKQASWCVSRKPNSKDCSYKIQYILFWRRLFLFSVFLISWPHYILQCDTGYSRFAQYGKFRLHSCCT